MKKFILIFAVACLLFSCSNEKSFKVSGTITEFGNPDNTTLLYLKTQTAADELINIDSTNIAKDGSFVLKGKSSETDLFFLADRDNVFFLRFFVDAENTITVKGSATDIENIKIEGSKTHKLYEEYLTSLIPIEQGQDEIQQKYFTFMQDESISEEEMKNIEEELEAKYMQLEESKKLITNEFIKNNSNNMVAAYLVYRNTTSLSNSVEIEQQIQLLNPEMSNKFLTLSKSRLEKVKQTEVGAVLPNIELPDTEGKLISLESLRGKYVLVDFWASWCGPCVKEIPNLKKAYQKYHDKGFEILSISLDHEKESWLNGIEKHELNWLNVSDLKVFGSPFVKQLAVAYVPHTFLLDPNGVIIAVDLREDALENKLAEVMQ
jgi:peroxiredoxin